MTRFIGVCIGAFFAVTTLALATTGTFSFAQTNPEPIGQIWPTRIVSVPISPMAITKCSTRALTNAMIGNGSPIVTISAFNRTARHLVAYSVRFMMYDHDGNVMGRPILTYTPKNSLPPHDLDEGEQGQLGGAFSGIRLSEPITALSSVSCRIDEAMFEGNRNWTYGHAWSGALGKVPVARALPASAKQASSLANTTEGAVSAKTSTSSEPNLTLAVLNAWSDTVGGNLYIHTAVEVQGGASDKTLVPANIALTMALANGGKKQYSSMQSGAPTYEKLSPLGRTTQTAYEVDPKDDFGRLGSIIVPAHGKVRIVATFLIGSDVLANPSDNRQVMMR